jgi:hypothetical protein
MSAGEAIGEKPAVSLETAVAGMRSTLADFRGQSAEWEREVENLFEDIETLTITTALRSALTREQTPVGASDQLSELNTQQQAISQLQKSLAAELAAVRQLVERPVEIHPSTVDLNPVLSRLERQFTELKQSTVQEISSLRQFVAKPVSAEPPAQWTAIDERLTLLQQTANEELAHLRKLFEKHSAPAAKPEVQTAPLERLERQLAEWRKSASEELTAVRSLVERKAPQDPFAKLAALDEQIAQLRQSATTELVLVRQLVETKLETRVPVEGEKSLPVLPAPWARLEQEITALRQTAAEGLAGVQLLSQRHESNEQRVHEQLERLAELQQQSAQCQLSVSGGLANLVERLDQTPSSDDAAALAQLEEKLSQLDAALSSQLSDMRQIVEQANSHLPEMHGQLAALAQVEPRVAALQQETANELATIKQLVEIQQAAQPDGQLAGLEQKIAELEELTSKQFAGIRETVESQSGSDLTEQLAPLRQLDEQLSQLQQSTATELTSLKQLVEHHSCETQLHLEQQIAQWRDLSATELMNVRHLVEQQTTLLEAFVEAAQRLSVPGKASRSDPVVDAAKSQFEQLQKKTSDRSR